MKSILQEFMRGNLHPHERHVHYGPKYKKVNQEFNTACKEIKEKLHEEDYKSLDDLLSLYTHLLSISSEEMEISAFQLGALFMDC